MNIKNKILSLLAAVSSMFLTSCMSSYYNRSASKGGMVEQGGSQAFNPFAGMVDIHIGGALVSGGGYRGGGYCPPPARYGRGGGCDSGYYSGRRPPQRYTPACGSRRENCHPSRRYNNYQRPSSYPERGTSWNRNGRGYGPVGGYSLPHPSGYMPPPFPY